MTSLEYDIRPLSNDSFLIDLPPTISEETLRLVLQLKSFLEAQIEKELLSGIDEITTTYHSLGVYLQPNNDQPKVEQKLSHLLDQFDVDQQIFNSPKVHQIPVCYDPELSADLAAFLDVKNMSLEEFVELHTSQIYTIYMKGFLPGFMYLGGLDNQLWYDRKEIPALQIPAGSVAIGGSQTGVYGISSPGGWWIVGRTPSIFFDIEGFSEGKYSAGDQLQFHAISLKEYEHMKQSSSDKA